MKLYAYGGSGTPIVATDLPNHREYLNEDSAVLVAPQSGALAEGILRTLAEKNLARNAVITTRAGESAEWGLSEAYRAAGQSPA